MSIYATPDLTIVTDFRTFERLQAWTPAGFSGEYNATQFEGDAWYLDVYGNKDTVAWVRDLVLELDKDAYVLQ